EGDEMLLGRVLCLVVADTHQRELDLQRRGADQAGELRLGSDLVGHEVQKPDLQRTDVLTQRGPFVHDGYALANEHFAGGELIGDLDRHCASSKTKRPAAKSRPVRTDLFASASLATSFTWLQADRPNHHGFACF